MNESKFEKLKQEEQEAKIARAKRNGTYKPGGNILDGGFDADDEDESTNRRKKARKDAAAARKNTTCPHCGKRGHKAEECWKVAKLMLCVFLCELWKA